MDRNIKFTIIILGIITLISLIFCIFGFITYTRSIKFGHNNNLANENENEDIFTYSISSSSDKPFCVPCPQNVGKNYLEVDSKSIPGISFSEYLKTDDGQHALINYFKSDNCNNQLAVWFMHQSENNALKSNTAVYCPTQNPQACKLF